MTLTLTAHGCLVRGKDRHMNMPGDCQASPGSRHSWGEQENLLEAMALSSEVSGDGGGQSVGDVGGMVCFRHGASGSEDKH